MSLPSGASEDPVSVFCPPPCIGPDVKKIGRPDPRLGGAAAASDAFRAAKSAVLRSSDASFPAKEAVRGSSDASFSAMFASEGWRLALMAREEPSEISDDASISHAKASEISDDASISHAKASEISDDAIGRGGEVFDASTVLRTGSQGRRESDPDQMILRSPSHAEDGSETSWPRCHACSARRASEYRHISPKRRCRRDYSAHPATGADLKLTILTEGVY